MGTERSDKAYEWWLQETTRFDYVVLGASLATVGYLANSFHPARLGFDPTTLELLSILAVFVAAFAGFKRIEAMVVGLQAGHQYLHGLEAAGSLMKATEQPGPLLNAATGEVLTPQIAMQRAEAKKGGASIAKQVSTKWLSKAKGWYVTRNWALVVGLFGLLVARIWRAYRC